MKFRAADAPHRFRSAFDLSKSIDGGASQRINLCGATSVLIYVIFCIYFRNYYFVWLQSSRNLSNVVLIPGLSLLLYAYWCGYRALKNRPSIGILPVVFWACLFAFAAFSIPSFYSSDVITYINFGWQQAKYHVNPYCLLVAGTPGLGVDPMLAPIWTLTPPLYGFAFEYLSKILCELGGGDLNRTVLMFKLTNLGAWALLGSVIYIGAQKLKAPRPDLSLYLFAWSPLILMHSLSGGHNDILMTLCAMSGILCAAYNIIAAPVAFIMTGILIKYIWIVALPFLFLYLIRKAGWAAAIANAVAGLIVLVCFASNYACRVEDIRWQESRRNFTMNVNSLPATIENLGRVVHKLLFHNTTPESDLFIANCANGLKISFLAALIFIAFRLFYKAVLARKSYSLIDLISSCVLIIMLSVCLVSGKFYPWYIVMFFPVALWLPERSRIRQLAVTLSCTQLFAVTCLAHGHANNFLLLTLIPFAIFFKRWLRKRNAVQAT